MARIEKENALQEDIGQLENNDLVEELPTPEEEYT